MFTGIVTALGAVEAIEERAGVRRLRIGTPPDFLAGVEIGDSIAVDGACLTAVHLEGGAFEVDAIASTLERTLARRYEIGARVNLEKAMVLGSRLDGHLVQGHVDGPGTLHAAREEGGTRFLTFAVPGDVWETTLLHGSITLNGVSLTVNALAAPSRVEVALIPHTWTHTNLGLLSVGDAVNVEGDLVGKYVGRILAVRESGRPEGGGTPSVQ